MLATTHEPAKCVLKFANYKFEVLQACNIGFIVDTMFEYLHPFMNHTLEAIRTYLKQKFLLVLLQQV